MASEIGNDPVLDRTGDFGEVFLPVGSGGFIGTKIARNSGGCERILGLWGGLSVGAAPGIKEANVLG